MPISSSALFASLFGKETLVGLDIGSAFMKAVQVEPAGLAARGFRVVRAAQAPTPPDAIRDGIVVDAPAVAQALRQMLRAAGITATGAVTAVAGPTVVVRTIRLPRMSEAALRKSVRYEAAKYINANVDDSAIEFEILGPVSAPAALPEPEKNADGESNENGENGPAGADQMNVMLVAASREMVESRLAVIEGAGLEAVAVDVEAFALQRALVGAAARLAADGTEGDSGGGPGLRALIDLGAAHTEVTLLLGDTFALTRSIPIAGEAFTNVFRGHFHCASDEAERQKAAVDLAVLLDPERAADPEASALPRLLQPTLDELLREVRRSIHYYQSQLEGENGAAQPGAQSALAEIILSGGGAQMGGIAPYMSARLGTQVRVGNAFAGPLPFTAHAESAAFLLEHHPCLSVCAGLAVKELLSGTAIGPVKKAA